MSCHQGCITVWTIEKKPCQFSVCAHDGREVEFVPLADFLPRVTLIARGVPDDVALEYIGQAALDFARKTHLLKRRLTFETQAGVQDYYLNAGEHEQIHLFDSCFHFQPPDKLWLPECPKHDDMLTVEYEAVPTQSACVVDKLLFDRYHDGIVSGCLANLLLMRQYDFADVQLAAVYERKFQNAVAQGKIDVAREFDTQIRTFQTWGKI